MRWARRYWWLLVVAILALVLLVWRIWSGRSSRLLERKLRRAWLDARTAEWKIKREEADQIRHLQKEVEEEQQKVGRHAIVTVERLAKDPSALVEAYRARLKHLKERAGDST